MNRRLVRARTPRWRASPLLVPLLLVPSLLVATACAATPTRPAEQAASPAPFADCGPLTVPTAPTTGGPAAPSSAGSPTAAPGGTSGGGQLLPDVTLPCFSSDQQVRLADLRGPAVINLWASWCSPCRAELPAFQRLAARTSGSLTVVGVNVRDRRDAAQSLAEDLRLTFPTLYDPEQQTLLKLQRNALPLTLFVDARGRVQHLDVSGALDDTALAELVERHLQVVVPS